MKKNSLLVLIVSGVLLLIIAWKSDSFNNDNNEPAYKSHASEEYLLNHSKIISDISKKMITKELAYIKGVSKATLQFSSFNKEVIIDEKSLKEHLNGSVVEKLKESINSYETILLEVHNFTYYHSELLSSEDRLSISDDLKKINNELFVGKTSTGISSSSLSVYNIYAHPDKVKEKYSNDQLEELLDEFNLQAKEFINGLSKLEEEYNKKHSL